MDAEASDSSRGQWRVYLGFAALAVLAGPVSGYAMGGMLAATQFQVFLAVGMAGLLAGSVLLGYAVARRDCPQGARPWTALLLLLVPLWCTIPFTSVTHPSSRLHPLGWGTALLLSLAAPLWLALVAALDLVEVKVPRGVVAAAIVGIGAVCLVIPTNTYRMAWNQLPTLVLQVLLGIATVASWVIARPRLEGWPVEWAAGGYLLMSALGDLFFAVLYQRTSWQPVDWHALMLPLLCDAAVLVVMWWLWFWLLQRMTLAAFGMRALAAWTVSVALGVGFAGFRDWRIDAALVIAVGAIVVALRARETEEEPGLVLR
jgi:hypothetical protein